MKPSGLDRNSASCYIKPQKLFKQKPQMAVSVYISVLENEIVFCLVVFVPVAPLMDQLVGDPLVSASGKMDSSGVL